MTMSTPSNYSFLPEDYLRRKADMRATIVSMVLFGGMLALVTGAFIVTNRQWSDVRTEEAAISGEYAQEAEKIDQLKKLEATKVALLERADVTVALIERVPRSILMAELINRMPVNVTVTDVTMDSRRIAPPPPPKPEDNKEGASLVDRLTGSDKKSNVPPAPPKPPTLEFSLKITGLATSDTEVADYQASLKQSPLLDRVDLIATAETMPEGNVEAKTMRKFELEAQIRVDADVSKIDPMKIERLNAFQDPGADAPAPGSGKGLLNTILRNTVGGKDSKQSNAGSK
jgi:Tfp pilus assembly protein PilN